MTTHATDVRDAATACLNTALGANSKFKLRTSGSLGAPGTVVTTHLCNATNAFGTPSTGTATANAIASSTGGATVGGVVATATFETSADVIKAHFLVAVSGQEGTMTGGLTVTAGVTVTVGTITYTALPA